MVVKGVPHLKMSLENETVGLQCNACAGSKFGWPNGRVAAVAETAGRVASSSVYHGHRLRSPASIRIRGHTALCVSRSWRQRSRSLIELAGTHGSSYGAHSTPSAGRTHGSWSSRRAHRSLCRTHRALRRHTRSWRVEIWNVAALQASGR